MRFETLGRQSGDEGLRDVGRAFNADLYDEPNQEAYFAELNRRGILNAEKGRAEQERLHAALSTRNTPEAATIRMNQILDRFKMRGDVVPVRSSVQAGSETQTPANRWVSWRRVFRQQTEAESKKSGNKEMIEIPGRIGEILLVNLTNASTAELIDDGHYNEEDPRIRPEAAAIEAKPGANTFQRPQAVPMVRFDRTVTSDESKAWLDDNELSASMKVLLTIGSQFPEEQTYFWLVAFDEAWLSRDFVPVLYLGNRGRRCLGLDDRDDLWDDGYRFPAARK